ncbi:LLM class flavin-dependent oxidoreductase [Arthrobacter castelli]|uniref:LLM class flavin-dependent oxidoreductase n=1 Tax=Arthrobacter castelli TaxID=271431 RepID=UPI000685215D|nr:LLM class flavin-dependent oxidoreductase [Arthrobacter castelli]
MTHGTRLGSPPAPLSVLDSAMTGTGYTASDSLASMIRLAELADRRGFTRFWMAEHHSMPSVSTSSPAVILGRLSAHTERIRLGSGGVMLPNHAPLVIAEQFGMLDALAPGRIDLGVGRAPGTDHQTAAALRRDHGSGDDFPQQVQELLGFLGDDFPENHPYQSVHAVPGPWQNREHGVAAMPAGPSVWLLGSSGYSAQLAGQLGRPYAFAYQFGGENAAPALELYRRSFRPSSVLAEPYAAISIGTMASEDEHEARRQARTFAFSMLRMFQGKSYIVPTPEAVESYDPTLQEREILDSWTDRVMHGTPEKVTGQIGRLQDQAEADEIMLLPVAHSLEAQYRSTELIADAYDMPASEAEDAGTLAASSQG